MSGGQRQDDPPLGCRRVNVQRVQSQRPAAITTPPHGAANEAALVIRHDLGSPGSHPAQPKLQHGVNTLLVSSRNWL